MDSKVFIIYIHSFRCTAVSVHCRIDISTGFPSFTESQLYFCELQFIIITFPYHDTFSSQNGNAFRNHSVRVRFVLKKYPSYDIKYDFIYGFKKKAVAWRSFPNFYVWGHNVRQRCGIYEHTSIIDILDIYELLRDFLIILLLIEDISHRMRI